MIKKFWRGSPICVRNIVLKILSCFISSHAPLSPNEPMYVLGAFFSSSGLGEGARLYAQEQLRKGKRIICLDITQVMFQNLDFSHMNGVVSFEQRNKLVEPGTIVIHANPPQFQIVLFRLGKSFLLNKRVIGYWAWEVNILPKTWINALFYLDAVEVPSYFVQQTIKKYTSKEVNVVPHVVRIPLKRKTIYMKNGVLRCLFCFDINSGLERKNPIAVIQAFTKAFSHNEAELTLKVSGSKSSPEKIKELQNWCTNLKNVNIITDILDSNRLSQLYCQHDIYISLHRSEGYGLTIQEAMLHGLHVVATGWSGNMDFMYGELAHPVPYSLIPINENQGPLKGLKGQWAEPDIAAAVKILQELRQQLLKKCK